MIHTQRPWFRVFLDRSLLAFAALAIIVGLLIAFIYTQRPAARRASGGNDFLPVYAASMTYAEAHEGWLPPLDPEPGRLMIDRRMMMDEFDICGREVTAEYDPTVPADRDAYSDSPELRTNADLIDDHSWWYLGYRVINEDEGRAFVLGYLCAALNREPFGEILPLPDASRLEPLRRLSLDPEAIRQSNSSTIGRAEAIAEAVAKTPFLIERPGHYPPYTGGWVCYLDGSREFIEYPGKFPMTEEFIAGLQTLDGIGEMLTRGSR